MPINSTTFLDQTFTETGKLQNYRAYQVTFKTLPNFENIFIENISGIL